MFLKTCAFALAALATVAFAQTENLPLGDISEQCQSALTTLSADSEISICLGTTNLQTLASVFFGNSTESVIGPLNTWLTGVCAVPACSDATVKKIIDSVTKDCGVEVPGEVAAFYPAARKAICLQEAGTNCLTQTLTNIEKVVGTINLSKLTSLDGAEKLLDNKSAFCTDCTKGIYTSLVTDFPQFESIGYGDAFSQQCGASFVDKVAPANIAAASTAPKSGAIRAVSTLSGSLPAIGASSVLMVLAFLA